MSPSRKSGSRAPGSRVCHSVVRLDSLSGRETDAWILVILGFLEGLFQNSNGENKHLMSFEELSSPSRAQTPHSDADRSRA